jgi:hypothetical protein
MRHLILCLSGTRRDHRVAGSRADIPSGGPSRLMDRAWRKRRAMPKELIKGNEAIVKAAILGGCRAFYGSDHSCQRNCGNGVPSQPSGMS